MVSPSRVSPFLAGVLIGIACWSVCAAVLPGDGHRDSEGASVATSVVGLSGDCCETLWWSRGVSSRATILVHRYSDASDGLNRLSMATLVSQVHATHFLPAHSLLRCGTCLRL